MRSTRTLVLALPLLLLGSLGLAQEESRPQEFDTLSTASYVLSPVEDSGIAGTVQIVERAEGGVQVIVSLEAAPLSSYRPVLYLGDCGPDREMVAPLEPVDDSDGNPLSSTTDLELSFEQLSKGDYFVFLLASDEGPLLACGEVGVVPDVP